MREKLINWLINDIAPAVERNHDPESTILKFASEHNLAPALVETLGQLYNTAKTVAHLEKSANRGSDFPILDVPKMVTAYLKVEPTKSAAVKSESAWDQFGCGDPNSLPAFFDNIGCPVQLVKEELTETPVKSASVPSPTRSDYREQSYADKTIEFLGQAVFEFNEDLRETLTKLAFHVKQANIDFPQFEHDTVSLYGTQATPVLDNLARFCATKFTQVKRASLDKKGDSNRVVEDTHGLLPMFEAALLHMNKIAAAQAMLTEKQAVKTKERPAQVGEYEALGPKAQASENPGKPLSGGPPVDVSKQSQTSSVAGKSQPSVPAGGPGYLSTLATAGNNATEPYRTMPELRKKLEEFIGTGFNSDQQQVDSGYHDARHLSVLQQLLMHDPVLADADQEKVVSMFNTLRQNAPSLAADPNIAGVALRSMIQHDGISPFDVKGFLETEQAKQKTDMNKKVLDQIDYGGATPPKPAKVQ